MTYQSTFKRYEFKYILESAQKLALMDALEGRMKIDSYGRTTIRNIYFDTDNFRLIRLSLDKPSYKEKLRVRSYKKIENDDEVFVELKKKCESIVYKRRVSVPETLAMDWLVAGGNQPGSSQVEDEIEYFREFYKEISPKVFISYEREAFYSTDNTNIRLTLDSNILARDYDLSLRYGVHGDNILSTDTGSISAISEETAQDYALTVLERSSSKGFIGDYRYVAVELENGNTLVIFCDCGIGLLNFRSFRDISIIISAVSLILISITIFLISGRAVRPVAESYEKQIRFITDAGHEIKTPLSIIIADTDVLEMDLDDGNEWIKDIKKQTERLTELTNNLVYLSKMEEGNNTLVMEKTDISAIALELSDSFKNVAIASNKKLLTEINEGVLVNCDRKSMRELFSILLDNAIKYSPESESITFKVYKNSRNAVIAVSNRAKENISNENLAHLFDRFYRTDGSRNSETGGHGLGLAIAKSIVANNKGSITAFKSDEDIIFTCKFQLS